MTSSGSWPAGSSTKRRVRSGVMWGRARRAARIAAFWPALSPSKQRIGEGSRRHMPLELGLGDRGAVGRDDLGDAGAVEGDHVHIAFDDDQAPGGAAGGAGAVDVVERAALVEERRVGGIEIFGLAVAEDPAAEADHPSARVADREHQPAAETVVAVLAAFFGLDEHAGFDRACLRRAFRARASARCGCRARGRGRSAATSPRRCRGA